MGWAQRSRQREYKEYYERNGHGMLVFRQNMNVMQNSYMLALEALKEGSITKEEFRDMWFTELDPPVIEDEVEAVEES
jgi:hypothetical protein